MALYIENGIAVDPSWESHILVSERAGVWDNAFNKADISVSIGSVTEINREKRWKVIFKKSDNNEVIFEFDPNKVDNKPAWAAGINDFDSAYIALSEILGWFNISSTIPPPLPTGAATETTLLSVLSAIQDGQDFEVKSVVDATDTVYLEIRIWNADTQTWETPLYYAPGSNTGVGIGSLTAPVTYLNPDATLASILAQLTTLNTVDFATQTTLEAARLLLVDIDANTDGLEGLLTAIDTVLDNIKLDTAAIVTNTADIEALLATIDTVLDNIKTDTANLDVTLSSRLNTLGQKASASSAPVVLSTEQEVILDAIKTAVQNIDTDLGTGGLSQESTQLLVKAVLDAIKLDTAGILTNTADIEALLTTIDADTSNLDVALSTRATEATLLLVKGVLDNIKLDTAAIDANTDGLEALLTTIDTVLDAIKLDTANLDVALSTRATEATLLSVLSELQAINIDTNGLSQEATQLLVKGVLDTIDAVLDTIKLDTGAMVIDLAAIEVLITTTNSLLTTIDGVLDNIKLDTAAMVTDLAAIETELLDQGTTLDAIAVDAAAIETELLDQGTTLDAIAVDAAAIEAELLDQGTTLDALETESLDQGTTLDTIETKLTGSQRTIDYVRSAVSGSTTAGVQSVSLTFLGTNGTLDGQAVPNGFSISFSPNKGDDTVGAIAYTVPTAGAGVVLIGYVL